VAPESRPLQEAARPGGRCGPESRPLREAARPRGALWPREPPPAGVMAPLDLDQYAEIAKECKYLPENHLKVRLVTSTP